MTNKDLRKETSPAGNTSDEKHILDLVNQLTEYAASSRQPVMSHQTRDELLRQVESLGINLTHDPESEELEEAEKQCLNRIISLKNIVLEIIADIFKNSEDLTPKPAHNKMEN